MHILWSGIMAYVSPSSSNRMLSLQIVLISVGVIFAAVILNLSFPVVTEFVVSDLPFIWNSIISWFKPPYLYLVINCIILTLIASSKFQQKVSANADNLPPLLLLLQPAIDSSMDVEDDAGAVKIVESVEVTDAVMRTFPADSASVVGIDTFMEMTAMAKDEEEEKIVFDDLEGAAAAEMEMAADSAVHSLQRWNSSEKSVWDEKPPRSNRFSHRKPIKSNIDGGRSSSLTLRVSKPKRHETLESTWKAITEGRAMPLTRHIRKSSDTRQDDDEVAKSETFYNSEEETTNGELVPVPARRRMRKLKREPSPGQDELNRRVEAFIKKFNEEMRLQRQRSLQQYKNMIMNGGTIT